MPFAAGVAPAWAVAWGEDAYGAFADLEVGGAAQRMRWIRPTTFRMGSPAKEVGRWRDEGPRHLVTLRHGYWLGDTPVTQAMWQAVMGSNPSGCAEPTAPVEQVSHEDCVAFMDALEALASEDDGLVWQLPSEAQWERACRGDDPSARGLPTWRGALEGRVKAAVLDGIAWYDGNSGGRSHPVAMKACNDLGLHDMLGNVWEWCADGVRTYDATPQEDPLGRGRFRVIRGGSWGDLARFCRAACRFRYGPGDRHDYLGLRLSRGPAHSW